MKKIINIGENQIALESNAATAIRYKHIFDKDLLKEFAAFEDTDKEEKINAINIVMELAYTMAMQADRRIKEASINDFYDWLEKFEEGDFYNQETIFTILSVWNKNVKTSSVSKNQASPQQEN